MPPISPTFICRKWDVQGYILHGHVNLMCKKKEKLLLNLKVVYDPYQTSNNAHVTKDGADQSGRLI